VTQLLPPVSAIADVLALIGRSGWLTPPLQPIIGCSVPTSAIVRTFRLEMGNDGPGLSPLFEALSSDLTGCCLLLDAQRVHGAVWGEILATAAHNCGASVVLVCGSVRDKVQVSKIGLPLYAIREIVVGPAGRAHVQEMGGPITIAASISGTVSEQVFNTTVDNGDAVVCDESGCVTIPRAISEHILDAARRYAEAELETVRSLLQRDPLTLAYLHKKKFVQSIVAELSGYSQSQSHS